jgi:hypothetical protein
VEGPWLRRQLNGLTRERSGWGELATSFAFRAVIASRLVVWSAGLIALALFGRNAAAMASLDPNGASAPFHSVAANFVLAPVARWDSVWYLQIAHAGYFSRQSSGMFPLYPLLIRAGSAFLHSELIVGMAISLVSVIAALMILERLITLDFDQATARVTVLLIAFFPVAFFLSAVYTESLYLLLSVGALYAARRNRWAVAGMLGGLTAATRSTGILITVPLLIMYLYGPRSLPRRDASSAWWQPRYPLQRSVAWLALVPVGLMAFLAYLGITHGQPLATYHAQQIYWGHNFAGPFGGIGKAIISLPDDVRRVLAGTGKIVGPRDPVSWSAHDLIDLGFLSYAVVGLIAAWRRVPFAYLAYTILLLALATSFPNGLEPLQSISRYTMVAFPLFIGWALLLKRLPRATPAMLAISTGLLAVFSGLWAMWTWVA